jgi:hypothetical protein
MRISVLLLTVLLFALAAPAFCQAEANTPMMSTVAPDSGRIGDVLVVQGTNLGQDRVAELFLTDGKNDTKVAITEQTPTSIQFKIPPEAKAGRFALMVLTKGDKARYVEEPVKVTVEPLPVRPETPPDAAR